MTHPFEGPRGLVGYTRFIDTYDNVVEVQQSSAVVMVSDAGAVVQTGPSDRADHCWLRIRGTESSTSAHLNPEMVRELVLALAEFLGQHDTRGGLQ